MTGGNYRMLVKAMEEMDLVDRHIEMLRLTKDNQPVGIIRLSEMLGVPKHKVRYSLRLLEREGLIAATPDGAVITDGYPVFMHELSDHLDALEGKVADLRSKIDSDRE